MTLDEATARLITAMRGAGAPPLQELTPQEARAAMSRDPVDSPAMESVYDVDMAGADGGAFQLRVLKPSSATRGVVVFVHGGGWVLGSLDSSTGLGRALAAASGYTVVMIGYRLAPEYPYPVGLEDSWAGLLWAADHVAELAGHPAPVVVLGDSSGGNLAALLAIRARDRGGPRLDLQVLVYPVTDCDLGRRSYLDPDNQLILTRDVMNWFWDLYLPDQAARESPEVSPMRVRDLRDLPAAIIVTAEYDVLKDESEAYADALEAAGVAVQHTHFDGQTHGFLSQLGVLPGSEVAVAYLAAELKAFAAADGRTPAAS